MTVEPKFLCVCLTSNYVECARRCIDSMLTQDHYPFEYDAKVFVNTIDDKYVAIVRDAFKTYADVEVIATESNGRPGKGKNSVINWFISREQYTYLIIIDGDDFLYPVAFGQIYQMMQNPGFDILSLQFTDSILDHENNESRLFLEDNFWLNGSFKQLPNRLSEITYDDIQEWFRSPNHVPFIGGTARILVMSRKSVTTPIRLWYSEDMCMYDDLVADFCSLALYRKLGIKYLMTSDQNIYVYDMTIPGVISNFTQDNQKWCDELGELRKEVSFYVDMTQGNGFDTVPFFVNQNDYGWQKKRDYIIPLLIK